MKSPGFFEGMRYPFLGVKHLLEHRELWPHAAKALIVGFTVFAVLAGLIAAILLGLPGRLFSDAFSVKTCLLGCLAVLLGVAGGIVLFTLIGNVIAGPFLEAMTERMMADAGRIKETPRGYWAAFRPALGDQAGRFALFLAVQSGFLVAYVTPAAFFHPIAALAVSIFFVALEPLEYPLEARGLRFFPRIDWTLKRLMPSMGFGTTLFFLVPVAGFVLLPASVCGAVLLEQDLATASEGPSGGHPPPSEPSSG